ncbi:MAG: hypothetical protein JWP71_46 [Mucilaginibacter sp.]|nr:hypothetical protein [Mucilaginibacter sp.]
MYSSLAAIRPKTAKAARCGEFVTRDRGTVSAKLTITLENISRKPRSGEIPNKALNIVNDDPWTWSGYLLRSNITTASADSCLKD